MKSGVLSNFTRSHISSDRVRSGYEITSCFDDELVSTRFVDRTLLMFVRCVDWLIEFTLPTYKFYLKSDNLPTHRMRYIFQKIESNTLYDPQTRPSADAGRHIRF